MIVVITCIIMAPIYALTALVIWVVVKKWQRENGRGGSGGSHLRANMSTGDIIKRYNLCRETLFDGNIWPDLPADLPPSDALAAYNKIHDAVATARKNMFISAATHEAMRGNAGTGRVIAQLAANHFQQESPIMSAGFRLAAEILG